MKLPPGEQLVSMSILTPQQTAAIRDQRAAVAAAEGEDEGEEDGSSKGGAEEEEGAGGEPEEQGPWMVIITARGIGADRGMGLRVAFFEGGAGGGCVYDLNRVLFVTAGTLLGSSLIQSLTHNSKATPTHQTTKTNPPGKRISLARLPPRRRRGSTGNIAIKLDKGDSVAMAQLVMRADDEILLASRQGQMARCKAADVRCPKSRSSRGVRLLALNPGDEVQACSVLGASAAVAAV